MYDFVMEGAGSRMGCAAFLLFHISATTCLVPCTAVLLHYLPYILPATVPTVHYSCRALHVQYYKPASRSYWCLVPYTCCHVHTFSHTQLSTELPDYLSTYLPTNLSTHVRYRLSVDDLRAFPRVVASYYQHVLCSPADVCSSRKLTSN